MAGSVCWLGVEKGGGTSRASERSLSLSGQETGQRHMHHSHTRLHCALHTPTHTRGSQPAKPTMAQTGLSIPLLEASSPTKMKAPLADSPVVSCTLDTDVRACSEGHPGAGRAQSEGSEAAATGEALGTKGQLQRHTSTDTV